LSSAKVENCWKNETLLTAIFLDGSIAIFDVSEIRQKTLIILFEK
jgi:hypothetical protein